MLVEVIQLRATGMKLSAEELREAPRHRGNLTITGGVAYLHRGDNPALQHVLTPLNRAEVKKVRGDTLLIYGNQPADYLRSVQGHPQAWACYLLDGPPEPLLGPGPR